MRVQEVSRGYQLSKLGITQRRVDRMVVVSERGTASKISSSDRT